MSPPTGFFPLSENHANQTGAEAHSRNVPGLNARWLPSVTAIFQPTDGVFDSTSLPPQKPIWVVASSVGQFSQLHIFRRVRCPGVTTPFLPLSS